MNARCKKECDDCECKLSYQQFIKKQFLRIEELENEVAFLRMERDQLLHENERILFNLQMMALKNRTDDVVRAREYRVGLNLFNKHPPERGIQYLFEKGFIEDIVDESKVINYIKEDLDQARKALRVAIFLLSKKGLSKQMIGEYLGDLQSTFNQLVLKFFVKEMDFTNLVVDIALRKFQTFFRFPGEAQKIERFIEVFSERYWECNNSFIDKRVDLDESSIINNKDDVFILSFAIIMLNTDLHMPNNKRCMTVDQWIKNLRGALKSDLKDDFLTGIYERIKQAEMRTAHDHCLQVLKVQCSLVASSRNVTLPNLCANTYRRLICFCRLHEIVDLNKKERPGQHQREVFLFNDLLLVTKVCKKSGARNVSHLGNNNNASNNNNNNNNNSLSTQLYSYRRSVPLTSVDVSLFSTHYYPFGIKISSRIEKDKSIILFNARNDTDRFKFFEDLKESIAEMYLMERLRMQNTLLKSGSASPSNNSSANSNRSSTTSTQLSSKNSNIPSDKILNVSNSSHHNGSQHSSLFDLSSSASSSPSSSFSSPKNNSNGLKLSSSHVSIVPSSSLDSVLMDKNPVTLSSVITSKTSNYV